ncbi:hypothetical protein RIR_jg12430.t1 [Rhizophagus irregularis DAOM 181602=DAOM 197198]|nr:hypothetical protein RIR_jg12430.t1 [Rhizophagus irregularis DAOM 181602=DAOM 197198]
MKERRYDLYRDVKCRIYLEENEDNNLQLPLEWDEFLDFNFSLKLWNEQAPGLKFWPRTLVRWAPGGPYLLLR